MKRRTFLRTTFAGIAAICCGAGALPKKIAMSRREALIAKALNTPEGRASLAQAMVEPIRRQLEYQAIGRKMLMVDELPQGAFARYERDLHTVHSVHTIRKSCAA